MDTFTRRLLELTLSFILLWDALVSLIELLLFSLVDNLISINKVSSSPSLLVTIFVSVSFILHISLKSLRITTQGFILHCHQFEGPRRNALVSRLDHCTLISGALDSESSDGWEYRHKEVNADHTADVLSSNAWDEIRCDELFLIDSDLSLLKCRLQYVELYGKLQVSTDDAVSSQTCA